MEQTEILKGLLYCIIKLQYQLKKIKKPIKSHHF